MTRLVIAIVAAPIVWGMLMAGGTMLIGMAYPEIAAEGPFPTGYLVTLLAGSVIYSLVTGLACAAIAGSAPRRAGIGAGLALLAVGLGVQLSAWETAPVWYHLTFLALLVPATLVGAMLWRAGAATA
jgi:hypothetical protein